MTNQKKVGKKQTYCGVMSRISEPYFPSWAKAVEEASKVAVQIAEMEVTAVVDTESQVTTITE